MLYNFKYEVENNCPRSIVEIDCERVGSEVFFNKVFVAFEIMHRWVCLRLPTISGH
jgi:hypothetical protein